MTTLVERLAGRGAPDGRARDAALRASILEHLRQMCRTRRGTMKARPDYGLPEISELVHAFPGAITALAAAFQQMITTYEPRLAGARVTHLPSSGSEPGVRFAIAGRLAGDLAAEPMHFEMRITAARAVSVT